MDTEDVWRLVEQARADLADTTDGDADDVAERVVVLLSQRKPAEIVAFEQPLWDLLSVSYRNDLWAAAYLVNGGASDDGFDYFRGWLIAQGRTVFERALADPDSLAEVPVVRRAAEQGEDLDCGYILAVVPSAYRAATGDEPPDGTYTIRHPRLDPDWNFDFDDRAEMRRRLPRLSHLHHGTTD